MKKLLLLAVILVTGATYVATTPYRAQQALALALQDGDDAALAALLDDAALRADLRLQLEATLAAGASTGFLAQGRDPDDAASAAQRAQAVVERLAAPAALRGLIVQAEAGTRAVRDPLRDAQARLAGSREFRITLGGEAEAGGPARAASELVLVRRGLTWRLARVTLAPDVLLAEVERLREEARAQRRQALQDEIDALQEEAERAARDRLRNEWQRRARALVRQQRSQQVQQTAVN